MTNVLQRLNISGRLLLILLTFMIPILILLYQVNHTLSKNINISKLELKGVALERPLLTLMNDVADLQVASVAKLAGDSKAAEKRTESIAEGDKMIAQLMSMQETAEQLEFTPEGFKAHGITEDLSVTALERDWKALIAQPTYAPEQYAAVIDHLSKMIQHLGNTSGMILDGDLDTFYLINTSLNILPPISKVLGETKTAGFNLLHANADVIPTSDRARFSKEEALLNEFYLPSVQKNITDGIHEDANFNGVNEGLKKDLEPLMNSYMEHGKDVVKALGSIARGDTMAAADYVAVVDVLHDETSDLAVGVMDQVDAMLGTRIHNLKTEQYEIIGVISAIVLVAIALALVVSKSITTPIKGMTDTMKVLADGNTAVEIPSVKNKDEIGFMARAVLVFKENMIQTENLRQEQEMQKVEAEKQKHATMNKMANDFESSVKTVVTGVSASAGQMRSNAERLTTLAGETKSTSTAVASSANEAAQTATQVAAAAEELTAAIGEISSQVQKSSQVANQASTQAENINQSMHLLVEKSNRVGEVIQFITNIASQINLLALNATIESARAGEAGRGFAVVASEVKNLANQTAKATEEIVQQVQSMQEATQDAVQSVSSIINIISEISASTAGVAAAVEEQSAATNEISRNITHTASGTNAISRDIVSVEKGADETGISSRQVLDSAKQLNEQSALLSEKVDEFLRMVRAA